MVSRFVQYVSNSNRLGEDAKPMILLWKDKGQVTIQEAMLLLEFNDQLKHEKRPVRSF